MLSVYDRSALCLGFGMGIFAAIGVGLVSCCTNKKVQTAAKEVFQKNQKADCVQEVGQSSPKQPCTIFHSLSRKLSYLLGILEGKGELISGKIAFEIQGEDPIHIRLIAKSEDSFFLSYAVGLLELVQKEKGAYDLFIKALGSGVLLTGKMENLQEEINQLANKITDLKFKKINNILYSTIENGVGNNLRKQIDRMEMTLTSIKRKLEEHKAIISLQGKKEFLKVLKKAREFKDSRSLEGIFNDPIKMRACVDGLKVIMASTLDQNDEASKDLVYSELYHAVNKERRVVPPLSNRDISRFFLKLKMGLTMFQYHAKDGMKNRFDMKQLGVSEIGRAFQVGDQYMNMYSLT